jgi:hypothetical protein
MEIAFGPIPEWQAEETGYRIAELRAKRELRHLRVLSALALVGALVVLVWLTTWFPGGIRPSDYNPRVVSTIILVTLVGVAVAAVSVRWNTFLRDEPMSEIWMALAGYAMDVRSRSRFVKRVEAQTHRAASDRYGEFALLILQISANDDSDERALIEAALPILRGELRQGDIIGAPGSHQLWALLDKASPEVTERIALRVSERVRKSLGRVVGGPLVFTGYSSYGDDGKDAQVLLGCAQHRLMTAYRARFATQPEAFDSHAA